LILGQDESMVWLCGRPTCVDFVELKLGKSSEGERWWF
jgi:hypothetical protein